MILEDLKKAVNEYAALVFTFTLLVVGIFICILFNINYAAIMILVVLLICVLIVMLMKKKALRKASEDFCNYYKIKPRKLKGRDTRALLNLFAQVNKDPKQLEIEIKKVLR